MGCDIHPALEVRRKGVWRYYQPKEPCKWWGEVFTADEATEQNKRRADYIAENRREGRSVAMRGWPIAKAGDRKHSWDRCKYRLPDYFFSRNYEKFAILGNVRNDDDEIEPISDCRGFPPDVDPRTMGHMSNEHSPTWVTLQEMLDYNILMPQLNHGVISEGEFIHCLIEKRSPTSWSGDILGPNIVKLTPEKYAELFGTGGFTPAYTARTYDATKQYHIEYEWYTQLADSVPEWEDILTYMLAIVPKGGTPEDVRMVMDFDS